MLRFFKNLFKKKDAPVVPHTDIFPLKGKVTKSIIEKANVCSSTDCIGYHTLKDTLKASGIKDPSLSWGRVSGNLSTKDRGVVSIKSTDKFGTMIDMMDVKEPMEVEFSLYE